MAHETAKQIGPGSQVRFNLAGQDVHGTVVEDRGPLGVGGRMLVRLQLDPSGSPGLNELEAPASDLEPRTMTARERKALEKLISSAAAGRRMIIDTALRQFRGAVRHVSMGLWPEHLAQAVERRTKGKQAVANHEAAAVLDDLVVVGAVVKRPSGLYISTDWLLKYLDETSFTAEWEAVG